MSALTIFIGVVFGACGSLLARNLGGRCRRLVATQAAPLVLLVEFRRLLTVADWLAFQRGYVKLLATSATCALARLSVSLSAMIPVVLAFYIASLLCRYFQPIGTTSPWFSPGEWACGLTATAAAVLGLWWPVGKR